MKGMSFNLFVKTRYVITDKLFTNSNSKLFLVKSLYLLQAAPGSRLQAVRDSREIGHFRVPKTLTFKRWPSAQPFLWKWVLPAWKIVSLSKAEHLTSFWYRGPGELGNGLSRKREHENKTWGNWGEEGRLSYKSSAHIFACLSLPRHPHYPNPLDSTTSCKRPWPPHRAD